MTDEDVVREAHELLLDLNGGEPIPMEIEPRAEDRP